MNNKPKRGRPTEAPLTERIYARVTEGEKARYLALGGSVWLRKQLAAAHDQGEVQKLREALKSIADCREGYLSGAACSRIARAALAASTGQEGE
ncbi:hypothetical protein MAJJADAN_00072 [Pseudomonas phage Amjad_SA]|nr:hypothetical protein MAJJADAN_00072 [Pseudomonas phage Amjad_SA]